MSKERPHRAAGRLARACVLLVAATPPQDDRQTVPRVYETVRRSMVGIEITLRKKTRLEKAELAEEPVDPDVQYLLNLAENQQVFQTWGVAVAKDLILMADHKIRPSDAARIDITDASGQRFQGAFAGIGRNHDFVLLKPTTPRELAPLEFSDWKVPALGEHFYVTFADMADGSWQINVSPYIQTNAPLTPKEGGGWFCLDNLRRGSIVSDKEGTTVGVALDQYLWVSPDGRSSFVGKSIIADERLDDAEARYAELSKAVQQSVRRIEMSLRQDKTPDFLPSAEKTGRIVLYGAVVDGRGTLLIPAEVDRDAVRKVEDIHVVDQGRRIPASFVGSFRDFGAILVRAEGIGGRPAVDRGGTAPPPGKLFFTAHFDDRFGLDRAKFDYNRLFRREPGLRGAARLRPRKHIRPGSFLLDFDGRIIGFATLDKKEEDIDEIALESGRDRLFERLRRSMSPEHLRRVVFFSEITAMLDEPGPYLDPKAKPMTKKEEKRLVWLGVEFQDVNKTLAEALGIQDRDLTHDGRRGLLVTAVYAGSPAEKAGLRADDVLISMKPQGENRPRDLIAVRDEYGMIGRYPSAIRPNGRPMWRPARNYLNSLLTEIGAGKSVTFYYVRDRCRNSVDVTLEYAPTDFETADRYKDENLGITVKELTYEVRHFLRMDEGTGGVVVAKVESGGKADVAKVPPFSVICKVNGVEVKGTSHFKELLDASKGVTLTVLSFGRTKLYEIPKD